MTDPPPGVRVRTLTAEEARTALEPLALAAVADYAVQTGLSEWRARRIAEIEAAIGRLDHNPRGEAFRVWPPTVALRALLADDLARLKAGQRVGP